MSAAPWGWSRAAGARVWRGARRRWLLGGVLAALLAAVLAPRTGAPGGGLRAEYSSWALVSYVHFSAGRRARGSEGACGKDARVAAACAAHAHLVSPALTAALLTALTDGVDYRIVKGVMLWSLGGGCAWLPLAFCAGGARGAGLAAPGGCALVYAASLLATPLHTAMLCGRAALPALAGVLVTLGTAAAPFAVGAWLGAAPAHRPLGVQLAALVLLYCECCERLCDAEAILYLSDVLVALALGECAGVTRACACRSLLTDPSPAPVPQRCAAYWCRRRGARCTHAWGCCRAVRRAWWRCARCRVRSTRAGRCRARRVACAGCRACSWRPRRRCCWRRWRPPPAPTATTSCCPATTTCCSPASSEAPRPPQHVTTRRSQSAQRPCS